MHGCIVNVFPFLRKSSANCTTFDIESTPRKVEVVTTRLFFFKLHFIPNEVTLFSTIAKLLYRYRCGDRNV